MTPVTWNFATMPSEEWKDGVGSALTTYAAGQTDATGTPSRPRSWMAGPTECRLSH